MRGEAGFVGKTWCGKVNNAWVGQESEGKKRKSWAAGRTGGMRFFNTFSEES